MSVVDNSQKDRGESVKKCAKMRMERGKRSGGLRVEVARFDKSWGILRQKNGEKLVFFVIFL